MTECHYCDDDATTEAQGEPACENCAGMFTSGDVDTPMPPAEARKVFAERLRESGLDDTRFIDVEDGEKAAYGHDLHPPDSAKLSGNYGVYGGPGADEDADRVLLDIDVDDYDAEEPLPNALTGLPETFGIESPHTDGDVGGHQYYSAPAGIAETLKKEAGSKNPSPDWGEIRVFNQYCVGPGSQLDGCGKDHCNDCADPDKGYYRIAEDRPIAELDTEDVLALVETKNKNNDKPSTSGVREPVDMEAQEVIGRIRDSEQADEFNNLFGGSTAAHNNDHSAADQALCNILAFWCAGDEDLIDNIFRMSGLMRDKWDEDRGDETYGERTIRKAVEDTDSFYGVADWGWVSSIYQDDDQSAAMAREAIHRVLTENHDFRTMDDTEELHRYNPETGVYEDGAEQFVGARLSKKLGAHYSMNTRSTVIQRLKDATWTDRDEMGADLREPLVGFNNCVVDIESGETYEHSPEHKLMTKMDVEYDPEAECTEFHSFLEDRVGDEEHIKSVYEMVGAAMAPGLPIDNFVVLHGPPGTGKSTIMKVMELLLGEENVASEGLHRLAHDNHAMTSLYNKRANLAGDMDGNEVKRTRLILQLAGGDTITANPKGKSPFQFQPQTELVFATNELPQFSSNLEAIMRRLVVIEVPNEIPDEEYMSQHAALDLLASDEELSGLANRAINAYQRLMEQHKFTVNLQTNLDARMRRYRLMQDPVARFFENLCQQNPGWHTPKAKVYDAYVKWCEDVGAQPVTKGELTERLTDNDELMVSTSRPNAKAHDHIRKGSGRVRCYSGMQLNDDGEAAVKALRGRKRDGSSSLVNQ